MSPQGKKYFPIKSDTACRLKWAWSTIFLNSGVTGSCHRASYSEITPDNFFNFHNTERKLTDRQTMLEGNWPGHGCEHCRDIENSGGASDRTFQLSIQDIYPPELDHDQTLVRVDPTILEVFFKNTCNLACVYCEPKLSSRIEGENKKFGKSLNHFHLLEVDPDLEKDSYNKLSPLFWQWLDQGYNKLQRIQVLGGEPFVQDDFYKLIDYIEKNPNPQLELNVITNLIIKKKLLIDFLIRIKKLIATQHLKNLQILVSVDCWGDEQEYIRYGFDCNIFEENVKYLIEQKFISVGILSTVTSLSIHSMPILAKKVVEWNKYKEILWYTAFVLPETNAVNPEFFGFSLYEDSLKETLKHMNLLPEQHENTRKIFVGLIKKLEKTNEKNNVNNQNKLLNYLDELDQRRNLNWKKVFPWLEEEFKKCGIVE
jgi:hypothetical protein